VWHLLDTLKPFGFLLESGQRLHRALRVLITSFYSDSGSSFVGNAFEQGFTGSGGGTEIIAVPEPETYFYAVALLAGVVIQYLRRRAKRKSGEGQPPA
jgi:hypothetical protein